MAKTRADTIMVTVDDVVLRLLVYDRKEDEDLPYGAIQEAVRNGELTEEDIVDRFKKNLHDRLRSN